VRLESPSPMLLILKGVTAKFFLLILEHTNIWLGDSVHSIILTIQVLIGAFGPTTLLPVIGIQVLVYMEVLLAALHNALGDFLVHWVRIPQISNDFSFRELCIVLNMGGLQGILLEKVY
jgi:hypothetical protein